MSTTTDIKPYDETEKLSLFFHSNCNGDIFCKETNEKICTSGPPHIVVRSIDGIKEKVAEKQQCFDGTLIRAFHYDSEWHLATRKRIDAFQSSWNHSESFGSLFEETAKTEVAHLDYTLNKRFAYTFLLLSPKVTNVLFNQTAELLFVSAYDRLTGAWEQICGETFSMLQGCTRPQFTSRIVKTDMLPVRKGDESYKYIPRNQRGWLYIGESGRIYREDSQKYRTWQRIINEKPLHICFFEQMKAAVKKTPTCVLDDFYQNYPAFYLKGALFELIVRMLRAEFASFGTLLPKPYPAHFQHLYKAVKKRNKLQLPSYEFIRRTLAFQKYQLLTDILFDDVGEEMRTYVSANRTLIAAGPSLEDVSRSRPPTVFVEPQDGNGMVSPAEAPGGISSGDEFEVVDIDGGITGGAPPEGAEEAAEEEESGEEVSVVIEDID
jgi:hypothetical protein